MTDNDQDAEKAFAKSLFSATDDNEDQDDDDEQKQRADAADDDEERTAQKRWVADLFAHNDEGDNVLAGLTAGRTVGRTTPPRRDETPKNEFRFS
jgi:hypothetical protein